MGQVVKEVTVDTPEHTTMYLRQAGLTRNPTFRIFNAFGVGDTARLRKPRSNANTNVGSNQILDKVAHNDKETSENNY